MTRRGCGKFAAGDETSGGRIRKLRAAWALGSFPVVIKEAMAMAGRDVGPTRRPILPLSDTKRSQLRDVVRTIQAESDRILAEPAPSRAAA